MHNNDYKKSETFEIHLLSKVQNNKLVVAWYPVLLLLTSLMQQLKDTGTRHDTFGIKIGDYTI
jgi:hypothetical protein